MSCLKVVTVIAMVLAIGFCLIPAKIRAQEGISVWPTHVELMVNRGEEAGKTINVYNKGSESIRVRTCTMDFSIDRDGNFNFYEPGQESYSASKWLNVGKTDLELAPGETEEVEVVVSPPAMVEPGGHYAALFFEAVPLSNQSSVSVSMRIPALFYITIPGVTGSDVSANADIISIQLPGIAENDPVKVRAVVRNSGNVHLTVAAKAYFSGLWGNNSELDLGQIVILPNSEVVIKGDWKQAPFLGKVEASVVIGYLDQKGKLINKSQTAEFWVIPWKMFTFAVVGLCLFVSGSVVIGKRFRFRVERK